MAEPKLGSCCKCGEAKPDVRNILMLPYRMPGGTSGWGCFECGLPCEGAVAVLCDACMEKAPDEGFKPKFACIGYPYENKRMNTAELTERFEHDMRRHPGEV